MLDNLYAKASALQDLVADKIDELIYEMGLSLTKNAKMYIGCCPIHGGDRRDALRLYRDGHSTKGNWVCYTRHCENQFKASIIGFVRGVLSHQQHGWSGPSDKTVSFSDTLNYICSFLGIKLRDVKGEPETREKRQFTARMKAMLASPLARSSIALSREVVRQHLIFPAQYYLSRGYSAEVLERFDVGLYRHQGRELSNRVVVPVYDDDGVAVIGFTGRSIFERCETCGFYHESKASCPKTYAEQIGAAKWRNHPKDFNVHSGLYNFWAAKQAIRDTGTIFLVEGQGEVWRLAEAGESRVCGLYGCKLSDEQQVVLERSGAMNVIAILNNDRAGEEGREDIQRRLCRSYRVKCPKPPKNDLGDLSVTDVRSFLASI